MPFDTAHFYEPPAITAGCMPIQIGDCSLVRSLRNLLESAAEARRDGDRAMAEIYETDALLLMRVSTRAAPLEGRV